MMELFLAQIHLALVHSDLFSRPDVRETTSQYEALRALNGILKERMEHFRIDALMACLRTDHCSYGSISSGVSRGRADPVLVCY